MPSSTPSNMLRAKLAISGLASPQPNALVAWHPRLSLDLPILVVLFFHGIEADPQNFAYKTHKLPDQVREAEMNAVLIAPTMQMMVTPNGSSVDTDYLKTHDGITKLLRQGLRIPEQVGR